MFTSCTQQDDNMPREAAARLLCATSSIIIISSSSQSGSHFFLCGFLQNSSARVARQAPEVWIFPRYEVASAMTEVRRALKSFRCWSRWSSVRFYKWWQRVIVITAAESPLAPDHLNPTSCSLVVRLWECFPSCICCPTDQKLGHQGCKSEFVRSYEGSCIFKTARSSSVCLLRSILSMQEGRSANPKTVHQPRWFIVYFMVSFPKDENEGIIYLWQHWCHLITKFPNR